MKNLLSARLIQDSDFDIAETLALSIIMHDVGKAATGFQTLLTGDSDHWRYRHEILSACLMDALDFPSEEMKHAAILAVITHHKDLKLLWEKYFPGLPGTDTHNRYISRVSEIIPNLDKVSIMVHKLAEEIRKDFPLASSILCTFSNDSEKLQEIILESDPFRFHIRKYFKAKRSGHKTLTSPIGMLLKGMLTASDHLASAEYGAEALSLSPELTYSNYSPNVIQQWASELKGSGIIIAPTGCGKTEAALLWLKSNMPPIWERRAFYLLPTTASINKMYKRIRDQFSRGNPSDFDLVSMLHHRSAYFLSEFYSKGNYQDEERLKEHLRNTSRKVFSPFKVSTPFQPLKAIFGVKGYERGLTELLGSRICVDEVHTYDPHVTALILVMLEVIKYEYNAEILLMSATFPSFLQEIFQKSLGIPNGSVKRVGDFYPNSRHSLVLTEGTISDNLDLIESTVTNYRTLVVCNTVGTAIAVYNELVSRTGIENSTLLHGKFALRDRIRIEDEIEKSRLLVATQAVEVSLDISYERGFTEPAPIDALVQRLGRINRRCEKPNVPVHVFRDGSEFDRLVYKDYDRVVETVRVIDEHISSGVQGLSDTTTQTLVEEVYKNGYSNMELEVFENAKANFMDTWRSLEPFEPGTRDEFNRLFDSVEVVPKHYRCDVKKILEDGKRGQIPEFLVGIRYGLFKKFYNMGLVEELNDTWILDVPYSEEYGLQTRNVEGGGGPFVI